MEQFSEPPEAVVNLQASHDILEEYWVKERKATRFLAEYMSLKVADGSRSLTQTLGTLVVPKTGSKSSISWRSRLCCFSMYINTPCTILSQPLSYGQGSTWLVYRMLVSCGQPAT